MEPQTYPLLEALGSHEAASLLLEIVEAPGTVEELAGRAGISTTTASRRLKDLAIAGVLTRGRPRDLYELTCPELSARFLQAASELAMGILMAREEAERKFDRRVRKTRLRPQDEAATAD